MLTPELLLEAYRQGLFPMAYSAGSPYVHWICPEERGQLSIDGLHIPKSLKRIVQRNINRNEAFQIKIDSAFEHVIQACGEETEDRPETWINDQIIKAYCDLHARGHAHSVEYWENGRLMGGVYGLAIGGAFFGESMYSRTSNASKIALVHLAARLWRGGYQLLDTQFVNPHLKQFGVYELGHAAYKARLDAALKIEADFMQSGISERALIEEYFAFRDAP